MVCCGNPYLRMLWVLECDRCPRGAWVQSKRRNIVKTVTTETEIHLVQEAPEPHMILRSSAKFLYVFVFLSLLILTTTDFFVWIVRYVDKNNLEFSITLVKLFQSKQLQQAQTSATNYKKLKPKASIGSWKKQVIPKLIPVIRQSENPSFFHYKIIFVLVYKSDCRVWEVIQRLLSPPSHNCLWRNMHLYQSLGQ